MGRKIVITGASSLIGRAIVKRVAIRGDQFLLHGFQKCADLEMVAECECEIVPADFTRRDDLDRFCSMLGEPDIVINAAAYTRADLLPNLSDDAIARMIEVNIRALIRICQTVLPGMMVRRRGTIINISSIAAQRASRGQSVYAGTKGFMESFTRSIAAEYGGRGIRANTVVPGAIDAGSLRELLSYAADEVVGTTVAGRLGTPEDVASAVAFLCGSEAEFINGASIPVTGGCISGV